MRHWNASIERIDALPAVAGPGPWTTGQLLAIGWSTGAIRAAVRGGRLCRIRHGVYATAGTHPRTELRAALLRAPDGSVVSHESAAEPRGLWLPRGASELIQLTKPGAIERTHDGVRLHGSRLSSRFVSEVDGIPMTTVARTAVDLARGRPLPEAMVVIDSAARALIRATGVDLRVLRKADQREQLVQVAREPLLDAFQEVWTWPGTVVLREAMALMQPASESPSESRSRGWMRLAALPEPRVAFEVQGASGAWYVSEFAWPDRRLLGEVDGFGKYGTTEEEVRRALRDQQHRQADLEDAGWTFVRWTSLEPRRVMLPRLAAALT